MKITRREFTKRLGGIGVGGMLSLGSRSLAQEEKDPSAAVPKTQRAETKLRRLGRTGLMLSPVGFGAQRTRDADLIRYALDQGINHIETAWGYGFGRPGNSCECVGKAIAGRRDSVCLAVAFEVVPQPTSKLWLANQFEQTLRDLGTDHIDVFLWHDQSGNSVNDHQTTFKDNQALLAGGDRVELMLQWKKEGKIRYCGLTTHFEQPECLRFAQESQHYDVVVAAFNYKSPAAIAQALQEASQKGIGLIAMKTQSPHYLEGGMTIGDAPDHRAALNWVLSKEYITAAIPGMTTRSQVDLDVGLMNSMA